MPSSHLILCRPLLLLPPIPPNIKGVNSSHEVVNESILLMRWPKYWSFSFNISPSNEHPGLISFRIDWLDLLAVQNHHMKQSLIFWTRIKKSQVRIYQTQTLHASIFFKLFIWCYVRRPKTTPRFSDLLERLTRINIRFITSKWERSKSSKAWSCMGEVQGNQAQASKCLLPVVSHKAYLISLASLVLVCVKCYLLTKHIWKSVSRTLIWRKSHKHPLPSMYQISWLPEQKQMFNIKRISCTG